MELLERLQAIRAQLVEVRNELKDSAGEAIVVDSDAPAAAASAAASGAAASADTPAAQPKARRGRKKKEEPEHKELFAFYEQSLF